MAKKVKCSQCKYLKQGKGRESFINPQGIHTTVHRGRYYCKGDVSRRFTDEQIKEFRDCSDFRPRTLTFQQEIKQRVALFLKHIFPKHILKLLRNKLL